LIYLYERVIVEAVEKEFMNFFSTLRRKTPQKAARRLLLKNSSSTKRRVNTPVGRRPTIEKALLRFFNCVDDIFGFTER